VSTRSTGVKSGLKAVAYEKRANGDDDLGPHKAVVLEGRGQRRDWVNVRVIHHTTNYSTDPAIQ